MSVTDVNYDLGMARWEPDSRGRLEQAALTLFAERGFENTTAAEIARRAGVTERTFFRHYADKREVLFSGSSALVEVIVGGAEKAPAAMPPLDALAVGLEAAGAFFNAERREFARRRQALISANPELQERELNKFAALSGALADTLRRRGVDESAARVAGDVAIALFRTAFGRWIDDANEEEFPQLVRESLEQLKALTASA